MCLCFIAYTKSRFSQESLMAHLTQNFEFAFEHIVKVLIKIA